MTAWVFPWSREGGGQPSRGGSYAGAVELFRYGAPNLFGNFALAPAGGLHLRAEADGDPVPLARGAVPGLPMMAVGMMVMPDERAMYAAPSWKRPRLPSRVRVPSGKLFQCFCNARLSFGDRFSTRTFTAYRCISRKKFGISIVDILYSSSDDAARNTGYPADLSNTATTDRYCFRSKINSLLLLVQ